MSRTLRLGTRGSPLAMVQARSAAAALEAAAGWDSGRIEIVPVKTSGDIIADRPLAEAGGKSLWTKELDLALLEGAIDVAVHSVKDIEVVRPDAIRLAAILPRTHFEDRLIGAQTIADLKEGAVVGTSSPRRAAQLLAARPDLKIVPIRGNVATRLKKLDGGEIDATILSSAGLHRLGLGEIGAAVPLAIMLPAPGQGAIGIECRADDSDCLELLAEADDTVSSSAIMAERAFARALGGSCHSPVAALARVEQDEVALEAEILAADGSESVRREARFAVGDNDSPARLARDMLGSAPEAIRKLFGGQ